MEIRLMGEVYKGEERRRFKRVKVHLLVVYRVNEPLEVRLRIGDNETQASMQDISEGGVAILTDINIPLSTSLWVRFTLAQPEEIAVDFFGTVELLGEVCYSSPIDNNKYRVGIKFLNIDENSKRWIADFIDMLENKF